MEDHNSPEAVAKRSAQEDPIVMYLIVRESLGMSIGKACAQCAHASQMLQLKFNKIVSEIEGERTEFIKEPNWSEEYPEYFIFSEWLDTSYRKVVLRADDKEWLKIKGAMNDEDIIVIDAGLTEIASGSETVIGLWPMRKSLVGKLIKKLQVLK
jgi:PTH2 family peptidyl-tRNA hydrolase